MHPFFWWFDNVTLNSNFIQFDDTWDDEIVCVIFCDLNSLFDFFLNRLLFLQFHWVHFHSFKFNFSGSSIPWIWIAKTADRINEVLSYRLTIKSDPCADAHLMLVALQYNFSNHDMIWMTRRNRIDGINDIIY